MTPNVEVLVSFVETYLERQGWYEAAIAHQPDAALSVAHFDVLIDGLPGLARLILTRADQTFQVLVGWRGPSGVSAVLRRRESALMGSIGIGEHQLVIYDALADDALCLALFNMATEGREQAERVRVVSSLTSHAALVFDDRLFMKCYRVLERGNRTEVEISYRLDEEGFNAMAGPAGRLHAYNFDLAYVREFVPGALEGRALALTSLRDLLAYADGDDVLPPGIRAVGPRVDRRDPDRAAATAGGDLASEIDRLGQTVAHLHLSLRKAFGDETIVLAPLVGTLEECNRHSPHLQPLARRDVPIEELLDTIGRHRDGDIGHAIRLHGELHLRRVMRSEPGWLVTGFSDDPLYRDAGVGSSLAPRVGTPIEDLADLCFSIDLVAREALFQRSEPNEPVAVALARAWVRRNQGAFVRGYLSTPGANALMPAERHMFDALLAGYQVNRLRRYEATFSDAS